MKTFAVESPVRSLPAPEEKIVFTGQYLIVLIILVFVLPGIVFANVEGSITPQFLLSAAITFYAAIKLTNLAFSKKELFLQLQFWMFVYCWLGLAGGAQIESNRYPWGGGDRQTPLNLAVSNLVILAGLIAYEFSVRRTSVPKQTRSVSRIITTPSLGRYIVMSVLCIGVSIYAIEKQGGISNALVTRAEADHLQAIQSGLKSDLLVNSMLQHSPPVIPMFIGIYLLLSGTYRGMRRKYLYVIFIMILAVNSVANYPPAQARVGLGFIMVTSAVLIVRRFTSLKPLFIVSMVVGLTILFPYSDFFRTRGGYTADNLQNPTETMIVKADYDAFEMISNTISTVDDKGVDFGYHLLGSFLFFVPRQIWTQKPYGTGQTVGQYLGYRMTNLSSPLWAEFYYAGGIVTVLLGFWLFGKLTRFIENSHLGIADPNAIIMAYAAGFQIFFLRGDLMNAIAFSIPGICVLLCFLLNTDVRAYRRSHSITSQRTMSV